ncbi:MAG: 4Fe-4S dicluster domain-containing protein [Bacteroidetes bacterium]|nr:4Fe-4S dicluster domain-containing protein [Bacteroidota bacterium]
MPRPRHPAARPSRRFDERDVIFSRRKLEEGSERYDAYYAAHPEREEIDRRFRTAPGLLDARAALAHPLMFPAADATFDTVDLLHAAVDGAVHEKRTDVNAAALTTFVKGWLRQLGAHSVGVTQLRDEHCYSHAGRGDAYGKEILRRHQHAIAFTVEMDPRMVASAPAGSIVMESSREYLRSGAMAVQVAQFLRRLGWPARAHIDGKYEVVCPLIARDAGLGEIGRMGLLMTPRLGPRVRIAVITTDAPLLTDTQTHDETMLDFCTHCKKCADACPGRAISDGPRIDADGLARWQIDSDACFLVWNTLGTDCGRCVAVCPYSHPDTFLHNIVRRGIRLSPLIRRAAIRLDDLWYGRTPAPASLPDWIPPAH